MVVVADVTTAVVAAAPLSSPPQAARTTLTVAASPRTASDLIASNLTGWPPLVSDT
jgi:hypothetical protein